MQIQYPKKELEGSQIALEIVEQRRKKRCGSRTCMNTRLSVGGGLDSREIWIDIMKLKKHNGSGRVTGDARRHVGPRERPWAAGIGVFRLWFGLR